MGVKLKQGLSTKLKTRTILIVATSGILGTFLFLMFFGYFNTGIQQEAKATTTETIPTGSFIVNMGITPQTFANGLLPYGMIYELTTEYNIPIKWVIEPSKAKDGTDFTHNSVSYRGGAFVIPATYISSEIEDRIEYWQSLGVQGNYSVSSMSLPVYMDITSFPLVIIDTLSTNDTIIEKYFTNAGIPSAAYTKGSPDQVNSCHDMWVNPHGDPTWDTHNYLYDFVTVQKSFIWMQCHAVSVMESCKKTTSPFTQLNYLTSSGLQCYANSSCQNNSETHGKFIPGSIAYFHPADPVMQFMGGITTVCSSGSERWFIPKTASGWNTKTKRLITTGTTTSPREGVLLTYGPAYDDSTNGNVMYTGGHDLNSGTTSEMVAAQRSFFNFLLLAGKTKSPALTKSLPGNINANATDTFSVSVTGGASPYTFAWTSSLGGTFSDPDDSTTTFSAPHTEVPLETIITCVVTDDCGRRSFFSQPLTINASPLPVTLLSFTVKAHQNSQVLLNWATASEKYNDFFTIERSTDGTNFSFLKNVKSKGTSNNVQYYTLIDEKPFTGISYYKLSQTDLNGTHQDVKTVKVEINRSRPVAHITAWPNPFKSQVVVGIPVGKSGSATVKMMDMNGKILLEKPVQIEAQQSEILIESLDKIPAGNYILKVYMNDEISDGVRLVKY